MEVLRRKTPAKAAALILALSMLVVPVAAQAQGQPGISIPIVGTIGTTGAFSGAFNLTSFAVQNGQLVAIGTLTGVITNAGAVVGTILSNIVLPVTVTQATCDILHLDLGPLSLNLLGLQVDLSRIVLDITAQAGAGNLLGNLLCAVAGLLDNPGGLAKLLNQILAILG